MDVLILILFGAWFLKGDSIRLPLVYGAFYLLRTVFMLVYSVQPYDGYYWKYPGFPSFIVAYGETNDFYFSGHVGACILAWHEYTQNGWMRGRWFSVFALFCQVFVMLVTRGHFFIDMVSGAIFADYIWKEINGWMEKRKAVKEQ